jgi:RHS repeat-associated protein
MRRFSMLKGFIHQLIDPMSKKSAVEYDFTAFGEKKNPLKEHLFNPWQYTSKRLDPEFGLIYFGKRYYDPLLGRWLTTDPAGFANSLNLYQYVLNNPFRYLDPDGQIAAPLVFTLFGASEAGGLGLATLLAGGPAAWAIGAGTIALTVIVWKAPEITQQINNWIDHIARIQDITWKNTDVYAPDRPLPVDENGVPVPEVDVPHTELGKAQGSKGKYPQAREFGKDGEPIRDIDFTDHGRPLDHTNPHQHKRGDNPTGGTRTRGDAEPLPEWRY